MHGSIWCLAWRGQVAAADRGQKFAVLGAVPVDRPLTAESVVLLQSLKEGPLDPDSPDLTDRVSCHRPHRGEVGLQLPEFQPQTRSCGGTCGHVCCRRAPAYSGGSWPPRRSPPPLVPSLPATTRRAAMWPPSVSETQRVLVFIL